MKYLINENNDIILTIPVVNKGKFRFKKRKEDLDFGKIFSTRRLLFDDSAYLEWQIGYDIPISDIPISDIDKKGKDTKLSSDNYKFKASNGKDKYPYELSEIFYQAVTLGHINGKRAEALLDEIKGYKTFIDQKPITVERHSTITLNGINYEETSIKLPTLFMVETQDKTIQDKTIIEVSIQKQQYASGVQPMIYFCIPINSFKNKNLINELKTRPAQKDDELHYVINESNVSNIETIMKVFGMASKRHNHDIVEILKVLLRNKIN